MTRGQSLIDNYEIDSCVHYVSMSLLVTGQTSNNVYYKYAVCKFGEDEELACEYGSLSTTDPTASSSIIMDCKPYDDLVVQITQYDATSNAAFEKVELPRGFQLIPSLLNANVFVPEPVAIHLFVELIPNVYFVEYLLYPVVFAV